MKPVMRKMSSQLMVAAVASTLAMASLALGSPALHSDGGNGAGALPSISGLPAPSIFLR